MDYSKLTKIVDAQWDWTPRSMSSNKTNEYKKELHDLIVREYGELSNDTYAQMLEDNWMDYLTSVPNGNPSDASKICGEDLAKARKILKEQGYAQLEYGWLPQGFLDYMHHKINNL